MGYLRNLLGVVSLGNLAGTKNILSIDDSGNQTMGGYIYRTTASALTAHAGGGQGSATPIAASINQFTTVATAADSAVLPASVVGMKVVVTNAHASNSMNVYPATGDAINALGANAAFALAAGKTAEFACPLAGQWYANLSA